MPGLDTLKLFANHAPYQLFRYGINWKLQQELGVDAVTLWEEREPNSLKAVLNAYAYIVPIVENKRHFNLGDICNIHYLCTQNIDVSLCTNADDKFDVDRLTSTYSGVFRGFGPWCGGIVSAYRINKKTCSEQGFEELKESFHKGDIYIPMHDAQDPPLDSRDAFLSKTPLIYGYMAEFTPDEVKLLETDANTIQFLESWFSDDISRHILHEKISPELNSIENRIERWKSNFSQKLSEVLANFYEEIEPLSNHNINAKLTAIVTMVQRFERIHPFFDANTRTFCLVLLNGLLMQYGFEPTLIDDPNKFDGYTVVELVDLVKQGIRRTHSLSDHLQRQLHAPFNPSRKTPKWMLIPSEHQAYLTDIASPLAAVLQPQKPVPIFSNPSVFFRDPAAFPRTQETNSMEMTKGTLPLTQGARI